jgi:hypothetical protein
MGEALKRRLHWPQAKQLDILDLAPIVSKWRKVGVRH